MTDEALYRELEEHYRRHHALALAEFYAVDAEVVTPLGTFCGRDEIAAMWKLWFEAFPDIDSEIEGIEFGGTGFVVSWSEAGTHLGAVEFGGSPIAPTGKRLEWSGTTVYSSSAGRIVRAEYQVDPLPLLTLLGQEAETLG